MANQLSPQHKINLGKAKQMTRLYREQRENILKTEFTGRDLLPISDTFGRDAIDRLLAQPGCASLRIYYGMDEQMRMKPILVGVDKDNQDILKVNTTGNTQDTLSTMSTSTIESDLSGEKEAEILDESSRCPPGCATSELNP